jgi:putative Holliday junction resolvase
MTATLGIDLGERRIGIAIADAPGAGARPLSTIRRGRDVESDLTALRTLIDTNGVDRLVVGLPIDAAGHEGEQAARTRAWVETVRVALGDHVAIELQDERLTSHVAETRIGPMPRGRSGGPPTRQQRDAYRARVDREAAAIILQDFLDSRRGATGSAQIRPSTMEPRP